MDSPNSSVEENLVPPSPVVLLSSTKNYLSARSHSSSGLTTSTPKPIGATAQGRSFFRGPGRPKTQSPVDEAQSSDIGMPNGSHAARLFLQNLEDSSVFSDDDDIEFPDSNALKEISVLAEDSFKDDESLVPKRESNSMKKSDTVEMVEDSLVSEVADSFGQMSTDESVRDSPARLPKYDRAKDRSRSLLYNLGHESPKSSGSAALRQRAIMKHAVRSDRSHRADLTPGETDLSPRISLFSTNGSASDRTSPSKKAPLINKNLSMFSTGEAESRENSATQLSNNEFEDSLEKDEEQQSLPDLGEDYPVYRRTAGKSKEPREMPEMKQEIEDDQKEEEDDIIELSSGERDEGDDSVEVVDEIQEYENEEKEGSDPDFDPESDKEDDECQPGGAVGTSKPPGLLGYLKKPDAVDERQKLLDMQRNLQVLRGRTDLSLPDEGYKLDLQLAKVNSELEAIRTGDSAPIPPKDSIRDQRKAWEHMYAGGPVQNRLFGGLMTHDRAMEARHVIQEGVHKLHKAIEERPADSLEMPDPPGLLIPLMQHQRQGLTWLDWRERQVPRGGILADDMGLGKTLSMIALILLRRQQRKDGKHVEDETLKKILAKEGLVSSRATLIVCPASLIHQWNSEVDKRVKPGKLRVEIFHGPKNKREKDPYRLARNDIVLTTYSTLANEVGDQKVPDLDGSEHNAKSSKNQTVLLRVGWERIILDEAHTIKNHNSKTAKACCRVPAGSRWALTGTPIHNKMMDFYALLRFLRCEPFDEVKVFKDYLAKEKSEKAMMRVNAIVKALLLRRTKDQKATGSEKPLVELTVKKSEMHRINLQGAENIIYQRMFEAAQGQAADFLKSQESKDRELVGISTGRYTHQQLGYRNPFTRGFKESKNDQATGQLQMLVLLTRLRQACAHLSLTKDALDIDLFKEEELGKEIEKELESELQAGSLDDSLNEFCIKEAKQADYLFQPEYVSAKIKAILERLDDITSNENGTRDKCIVVSQWTSLLDIVEIHLRDRGMSMTRIDGKVKPIDRQDIVEKFNKANRGPTVMLLSLKAGGVGLNLVGANHLFLMDLHWNPALEQQAMDRIYRMGQKKDVFVHKFVCVNTIEEKVAVLQEKKMELSKSVLEGGRKAAGQKLTLGEIRFLFQLDAPPLQGPTVGPYGARNGAFPLGPVPVAGARGTVQKVLPSAPPAPVFRERQNLTYKWQD